MESGKWKVENGKWKMEIRMRRNDRDNDLCMRQQLHLANAWRIDDLIVDLLFALHKVR